MLKNVFIVFVIFVFLVLPTTADTFKAENALPANTLFFASVDNGKTFCEEMRASGLWKLFTSDEWKAFFDTMPDELHAQMMAQKQQMEQQVGLSTDDVFKALSGQISVALIDLEMKREPYPHILISWDMGDQKPKLEAILNNLKQMLLSSEPETKNETVQIGTYQVEVLHEPHGEVSLYFAFVGNTFLVSTAKSVMESALTGVSDSLANSAGYQAVRAKTLQNHSGALVYLNVAGIVAKMSNFMSPSDQQALEMMQMVGLDSFTAAGAGLSFRNGHVTESFFLHSPEGRKNLIGSLLPSKVSSQNLIKYIPEKVIGMSHGALDIKDLYESLTEFVQKMEPREYKDIEFMEQQIQDNLGFDLRQDLLAHLGDELLVTVSGSGGLIPDIVVQIALRDKDKFSESFQKLVQMVPENNRFNINWKNHNITYFNFSTSWEPIPVAPTFVIKDDCLLVTLYPESAKNFLWQRKAGQIPASLVKSLAGRPHSYMEYLDVKALLLPIYRTAVPLVQSLVPRSEVPLEFGLLPSANLLDKYLDNMSELVFCDESGLLVEWHSPFGIMGLVVAAGAGAAFYGQSQARSTPPRWDDKKYDDKWDDKKSHDKWDDKKYDKDPWDDKKSDDWGDKKSGDKKYDDKYEKK